MAVIVAVIVGVGVLDAAVWTDVDARTRATTSRLRSPRRTPASPRFATR